MGHELDEAKASGDSEDFGCRGCRHRWGGHRFGRRAHMRDGERLLSAAETGTTARVLRIFGDEDFRGKMMAMGIVPGASITVLSGGGRQPLLVALASSRFVIDRASSEMIMIGGRQQAIEISERGLEEGGAEA